ncbi:MAG: DUF882 domain-containing protein [Alphaproteobacteria bacterium]|nr:DUF882 domain-containing protein [Alphaproteobacteria bacterium]
MADPVRRTLLRAAFGTVAMAALPTSPVFAAQKAGTGALSFVHLHTGEKLSVTYRRDGAYDQGALKALNHMLRDWRTDDVIQMDVALLDLLVDLRHKLGTKKPFEIVSAYRSPLTNATLAAASNGVAKKSYHMKGMAIDIRVPGYKAESVYPIARSLKAGGVGAYKAHNFVHVDTGPVRTW